MSFKTLDALGIQQFIVWLVVSVHRATSIVFVSLLNDDITNGTANGTANGAANDTAKRWP